MIGTRVWNRWTGSSRQLRIEAKRSVGPLAFPVLALAGWSAISGWLPRIALWPEISTTIPNMVDLVAPLAGGLAAWMAGRETRQGMGELMGSTAQSPARRALMVWVSMACWAALSYIAVAAALLVWAALGATWGGPYWSPILVGLLAVVAGSALGFAAGCWLPGRFTAPLVAVLLFVALQLLRGPLKYLDPTSRPLYANVFYGLWPALDRWRSLWLVGMIGVALAAAALRHRRTLLTWAILFTGLSAGSVGATALLRTATDPARPVAIPYTPVCEHRSIPICVHPAYRRMLPRAAEMIDGVVRPLAGVPGGPRRADQVLALPIEFPNLPIDTIPFRLEEAVRFDWGWQNIAQNTVELLLPGRFMTPPLAPEGTEQAQKVVAAWLLQQARVPKLDASGSVIDTGWDEDLSPPAKASFRRFAALDPAVRHAWLVQHFQELRAGRIAVGDLP